MAPTTARWGCQPGRFEADASIHRDPAPEKPLYRTSRSRTTYRSDLRSPPDRRLNTTTSRRAMPTDEPSTVPYPRHDGPPIPPSKESAAGHDALNQHEVWCVGLHMDLP